MPQTRYPLGRIKQHDPRSAAYSIGLTDEELWHAAQNWAAGKGFITVG